jgi:hypothetical protein
MQSLGIGEYYIAYAQNFFDTQAASGIVYTSADFDTVIGDLVTATAIVKANNPEALTDPAKYDATKFSSADHQQLLGVINAGSAALDVTVAFGRAADGNPLMTFRDIDTGSVINVGSSNVVVNPIGDTKPRTTGFEVDTSAAVLLSVITLIALAGFSILFMKRKGIVH